jgi:3D (Asp-Asp-Asp) domain-containing protein
MKKILSLLIMMPLYTNSEEVCNELPKVEVKETRVEEKVFSVSATIYNALPAQCDSNALETASGFKLDTINNFRFRVLAISRDLKKRFPLGSRVRVSGIKPKCLEGIWKIEDVMNKRFTNKIDFLVDTNMRFSKTSWANVQLELI